MKRRRRRGDPKGCLPLVLGTLGIVGALGALGALALSYAAHAQERPSYLPPPRYTEPATPSQQSRERAAREAARAAQTQQEYYAEDWIVVGPDGTVVCKDPYVRLAHKYIECVSSEPVR